MSISNTSSTPKNLYPSSVRIGLMNPDIAQTWAQRVLSNGITVASVKKGDTINHTTSQPIMNGLFCQRIFGPCTDYTCACGHEKIRIHVNVNVAPLVCPECNVEWTLSSVRRQQLGLIELLSPVTHKWFSNGRNYIPILTGITIKTFKGLKECKLFFPFPLQGLLRNKTIPYYTGGLKKFISPKAFKSSKKKTRLMTNLRIFAEFLHSLEISTPQKNANVSVYNIKAATSEMLRSKSKSKHVLALTKLRRYSERELIQDFYSLISTVEILQRGEKCVSSGGSNITPRIQKNFTSTKIFNVENSRKPLSFGTRAVPNNSLKTELISWKVKKQIQTISKQKQTITYYNGITASKKTNTKSFNSTDIVFNPAPVGRDTLNNFEPFLTGHVFRNNFESIETLILNSTSLKRSGFCYAKQARENTFCLKKPVRQNKNTIRQWSVTTVNTNNPLFYERGFFLPNNIVQLQNYQHKTIKNDVFTDPYKSSGKFGLFCDNQNIPVGPSFTQPEDYRRQFLNFIGSTELTTPLDVPIVRYTSKKFLEQNKRSQNGHKLETPFYWGNFYGAPPLSSIISGLLGQIQEPSQLVTLKQKEPEKVNSIYVKQVIQPPIEIYFSETKSAAKEQTIKKILLQTGGGGLQKYLEQINVGQLIFFLQKDLLEIAPLLVKSQSMRRILAFIVNKTFNDINKNYSLLEQINKESNSNLNSNTITVFPAVAMLAMPSKHSKHSPHNQFTLANKIENLEKQYKDLKKEYKIVKKICNDFQNRKNINKRRYKLAFQLFRTMSTPAGMILSSIPVLPPGLRPIIDVPKIGPITADLNIRYRALVFALRNLRELAYVDFRNTGAAQASVQEAVDELLYTGGKTRRDKGVTTMSQNLYKSLAMRLKGKHGRFRGNLLGKRVDYSGRSVIVVGPTLKIHQCGLPFEIAIKLFNPFLIRRLIQKGLCKNVYKAKQVLIKQKFKSLIWALCREVMLEHLVLLNRAPTLHRLGVQAFMPILVSGRAILLHPLVCTGFNADFDGDQMGVHVPLFSQARAEAWKMMWSRNNFLSPSSGEPILLPSQDMVLGCYYLTESSLILPYQKTVPNSTQRLFSLDKKSLMFLLPSHSRPLCEASTDEVNNNTCLATPVPFTNYKLLRTCFALPTQEKAPKAYELFKNQAVETPRSSQSRSSQGYQAHNFIAGESVSSKALASCYASAKQVHMLRRRIKGFVLGTGVRSKCEASVTSPSNKDGWSYNTPSRYQEQGLLLHSSFNVSNRTLRSVRSTCNIEPFKYDSEVQRPFSSGNATTFFDLNPRVNTTLALNLKKENMLRNFVSAPRFKNLELVLRHNRLFSRSTNYSRKARLVFLIYVLFQKQQTTNNSDINISFLSNYETVKLKINKIFGVSINSKLFCTPFIIYLLVDKFFWPLNDLENKVKQLPAATHAQGLDFIKRKQNVYLRNKGLGTNYENLVNKQRRVSSSIYGSKNYKIKKNKFGTTMVKIPSNLNFPIDARLCQQKSEILSVKTALEKYTRGLYNLQSIVWVKSNTRIKNTECGGLEGKIPSLELRVTPYGITRLLQVSELKKSFFQKSVLLPSKIKNTSPFEVYSVRTTIGRLLFNDVLKKFDTP